jgi:acyl-CoA dehydrogenase
MSGDSRTAAAFDETSALIAQSVEQVFAAEVTPERIIAVERGEWPEALWHTVSEAGFDAAPLPEALGGVGSWAAVAPILVGIGRWQVPLPLAESMIGRYLGACAGFPLPEGPVTVCEAQGMDAAVVDRAQRTGKLDARLMQVPWARYCRAVLVDVPDAPDGGALLCASLTGDGVVVAPSTNMAGEPRDTVMFQDARCEVRRVSRDERCERPLHLLGAFSRSAMLAGAIASVLEQSARYAGERKQFGRPIGAFQAIQQQLAVLAAEACAARTAVDAAAQSLPRLSGQGQRLDRRHAFDVAVAKIRTGEAATQAASIAHAVHGAIGFTHEHRLHLATRRLWSWRAEFGSDAQWAAWLGRAAIAARSRGFWEGITARSFPAQSRPE